MIIQRIQHRIHFGILRLQTQCKQCFSCVPALGKGKPMPPRPSVIEDEIVEVFLKGSGPGGQKTSAVQLKHIPTGLVVKSQATRSREQNRKIARNILAMKLDERLNGAESRHAKLVEKAQKKKASKTKKAKRKYAKLDTEKNSASLGAVGAETNDDLKNDEETSLDANTAPQYALENTPEALDEIDETITGSLIVKEEVQ